MRTFELTSSLFPIVQVGTYDGQTCDVDRFIDSYCIDEDFAEGHVDFDSDEFWSRFDNSKFKAEIVKRATDYISNEVKPFLVDLGIGINDVVVHSIVSPKYYNFSTDELYFDLVTEDDFTEKIAGIIEGEECPRLSKFLKDNYTSYDGFISFTANTIEGLIEGVKDGDVREISAFLTWYVFDRKQFDGEWKEYLYEDFPFYTEFINE